jgi:hypothetical protein
VSGVWVAWLFAWLAWYMSKHKRIAANDGREAVQCGDEQSLQGKLAEPGPELGGADLGNFTRTASVDGDN